MVEITGADQKQAWVDKRFPSVEALASGWWSIPTPVPIPGLRYVLSYVAKGWSFIRMLDLKGRETHCSLLVKFDVDDVA